MGKAFTLQVTMFIKPELRDEYLAALREFLVLARQARPFQDRFEGLNHDPWRVLRCDHERRAGRGKVTKLR